MAKILEMPKLSPTMEEGVLVAWHKNEGDDVAVDDLLADVETDKATMEFRAFDKGTLLKRLVAEGANVKLGQPVAIVGAKGEDTSALEGEAGGGGGGGESKGEAKAEADAASDGDAEPEDDAESEDDEGDEAEAPPASKPKASKKAAKGDDTKPKGDAPKAAKADAPKPKPTKPLPKSSPLDRTSFLVDAPDDDDEAGAPASGGRVLASPHVRKLAREKGVDLRAAAGSGDRGRIVPGDVDKLAKAGAAGPGTALAKAGGGALAGLALAEPEVRPNSMMRKTIAKRLTQSKQTVPHFYLTIDVDAAPLARFREQLNDELAGGASAKKASPDAAPPTKVSVNDLLIKAVAQALVNVPECNAQFTDEAILVHQRVDVSVAVAVPDGLVTPVVRNADQKSVVAIGKEVRELAARARQKKLKPEEMSNGTFSVSNLGMFGIDAFSAVINPPEGAILAIGQVRDVPVVDADSGQIVPGKRLSMTLSCDHRVIDGAVGAAFLAELRALVERPMRILTG